MTYSIIIPSHNEEEHLADTVRIFFESVQCCDEHQEGADIVAVDDMSTDDSVARLRDEFGQKKLTIVQNEKRRGTSGSRKAGVAASSGEMIIGTDAHMSVKQGWLHDLEDGIEACGPGARDRMLFGPRMHNIENENNFEQGQYWRTPMLEIAHLPIKQTLEPYPVMTMIGCGHIISRKLYDAIGGYLHCFIPPWGIDEELGLRVWVLGGECRVIPRLNMSTLYRAKFPYEVPMVRVTFNHLLMARMYFDDARFMKVMQARLEDNQPVLEALAWMTAGNPRAWVQWLKKAERRSVDEVFDMFGVEW